MQVSDQDEEVEDVSQMCSRLDMYFSLVSRKTCGTLNASSNFLNP